MSRQECLIGECLGDSKKKLQIIAAKIERPRQESRSGQGEMTMRENRQVGPMELGGSEGQPEASQADETFLQPLGMKMPDTKTEVTAKQSGRPPLGARIVAEVAQLVLHPRIEEGRLPACESMWEYRENMLKRAPKLR